MAGDPAGSRSGLGGAFPTRGRAFAVASAFRQMRRGGVGAFTTEVAPSLPIAAHRTSVADRPGVHVARFRSGSRSCGSSRRGTDAARVHPVAGVVGSARGPERPCGLGGDPVLPGLSPWACRAVGREPSRGTIVVLARKSRKVGGGSSGCWERLMPHCADPRHSGRSRLTTRGRASSILPIGDRAGVGRHRGIVVADAVLRGTGPEPAR